MYKIMPTVGKFFFQLLESGLSSKVECCEIQYKLNLWLHNSDFPSLPIYMPSGLGVWCRISLSITSRHDGLKLFPESKMVCLRTPIAVDHKQEVPWGSCLTNRILRDIWLPL